MQFFWSLCLILITSSCYAQSNDSLRANEPPTQSAIEKFENGFSHSDEFQLSVIVAIFALLVFIGEIVIVIKQKLPPETAVRFIVVTLIIFATLFLITAGYNNNQIAPATGLLGTIAGYLLGKTGNSRNQE